MGILADAYGYTLRGDGKTFPFSLALESVIVAIGAVAVVVFVVIVQCIPSNLEESCRVCLRLRYSEGAFLGSSRSMGSVVPVSVGSLHLPKMS